MKKILLTLVLLIGIVVGLFAQKLTYQAVIRDNNQQLVVNTAVKATVTITFTTGVPYAEEVNGSTNIHGLLSFEFGDETLAGRDWTGANIAVKVVNAATPSTVYVNDEARPVSAVPYALNVNGQSIQNYLTEHNYVDETELDSRHYLTSDSTVITTMQGNIANLTQHTTKSAIRDSVAGQIHDSIADIAAKSHTHGNKDLLDTYNQTNADLADAVAKKHAHDNAAVLAATTAPYTDADSIKLKGIAEGAEVNVQADWNQSTTTADDYIKNKPTIPTVPTNVSAFSNDAGYITATDVPAQVNADWNATSGTAQILNKPELFSGNYNDLSNKPTIPTVPTNVSAFSNDAGYITATDVPAQVNADWNATSGTAQILNKPELFSGNYNDLSNKPTIPAAANNATLTIQKNGTSMGTFTADASFDKSINITVPTTTSELTNNSGFITTANVPTNVSQLNNDAGYLTNADLTTLLSAINGKIDSLAHLVDSLSNLTPGGEPTATFTCGSSKVKDVDNNEYNTVKIGNQCWMAQNLRTSTNTAGAGNIYTPTASEVPGYDVNTYGRLYDWAAVMQGASSSDAVPSGVQGICPTGWHVPSDAEWTALTDYVNTEANGYRCNGDGTIAKALSQPTGWSSNTNEGCNAGNRGDKANATGFSAVPAGGCSSGDFSGFGGLAYVWSATQYGDYDAWRRILASSFSNVLSFNAMKDFGSSVRCLRDAGVGGGDNPSAPAMMSCEQVMECMGDTLGQLNAKIEAQGAEIETLNGTVTSQGQTIETLNSTVESQGNTIDRLAHLVDSLSNLTPGGGDEPATFTCGTSKVKDVDNNEYNTVKIGSQCWMAQNLRTSTNTAGAGNIYTPTASEVPGYDVNTYGRLYDWAAVMQGASSSDAVPSGVQGICPTGWHVPSDAEWDTLTYYVYYSANPDYKCAGCSSSGWNQSTLCIAKALSSTTGWNSNTESGCNAGNRDDKSNLTGFSAVPAGGCFFGDFYDFGDYAFFWSATQGDGRRAWCRRLNSRNSYVISYGDNEDYGFSVRCLRDAGVGGGTTPSAPGGDNACCSELGARLDSLEHVISSQDSTINALNNQVNPPFVCGTSTVTDHEGNVYNTVQVGDQCWTKENMRCTTSPSTGTNILEFPASSYTYSGKKAYYPNDDASNVATYGLLYNWNAAVDTFNTAYGETSTNTSSNAVSVTFGGNRRGICPVGWHVPSDAEWDTLTHYVFNSTSPDYKCGEDCGSWSAQSNVSCIAKALSSTTGWSNTGSGCNAGNTGDKANATGFSAVPAGGCDYGNFINFGNSTYFWSATQGADSTAWCRELDWYWSTVGRYPDRKDCGYSVRCLRD